MKIILNIATHGTEQIGYKVAKEIAKLNISRDTLIVQIANERASKLRKRFIDQDLNRSFPGRKNGNHEERLAYKLSPIIRKADLVIDIHSTTSELKDAIILTKLDAKTLEFVKVIQPRYVLLFSATKNNALISQAKIGIGFEYGKDQDKATIREVVTGVKRLLNHLGLIEVKLPKPRRRINYFNVSAKFYKPKGFKMLKTIKDYKLVRKGETYAQKGEEKVRAEEDFYPILFGEKTYTDYYGFKGYKMEL